MPAGVIEDQEIHEENNLAENEIHEEVGGARTEVEVNDVPPRPSLLTLSWTFLTTFFTSIIPEQQQIV